jgi:transposase
MNLLGWFQICRQLWARCLQLEAELARLKERNAWLEGRVSELKTKNTRLMESVAAAKKNSSTSSKPPSSDIVKPPAQQPKKKSKRRIGAQKGHPKHEHVPFAPDQVDEHVAYRLGACPVDPSHKIIPAEDRVRTLQQVELAAKPILVTEHTAHGIWCHDCHCYHDAPFPEALTRAGLFGPRLTSLVCYSKGRLL